MVGHVEVAAGVEVGTPMSAARILDLLRAHHRTAALVAELTISDYDWPEHYEGGGPSARRIDALMFDALQRTAIEIKVTRADAARETWGKTAPWRRVCHRFVYACPAGLLEHPPIYNCGLWWVYPDGRVEVRRRAKLNPSPEPLPQHVVQTLAYRSLGRNSMIPDPCLSSDGPVVSGSLTEVTE